MSIGNVNSLFGCPSENDLLAFYRARLESPQMDAIQAHLEACDSCILFFDAHDERSDTIVQALTSCSATTDDELEFQQLQAQLLHEPEQIETAIWPEPTDYRRRHPQERRGETVGEYELVELIGCGANGAVYKALHRKLDRFVALKLLDPKQTSGIDTIERFLNEMKAVGRLDHPNIVRATDAGNDDGQYFLAMEHMQGCDVSRLVRQHGSLSVPDAAEIIRQAAVGLHFAHDNGMIHRDVKPSNLFFEKTGNVKILDLGLVSISESPDHDAPNILARGTADYMSPEQWENYRRVDLSADIYSLGCAFFKLLTGEAPFAKIPDGFSGKMQAHQFAPVPPLREYRTDVPLGLERLIRKMVSKKPVDRPNSMDDIQSALVPYAVDHDLQRLLVGRQPLPVETATPTTADSSRRFFLISAGLGSAAFLGYQFFAFNQNATRKTQAWRSLVPTNGTRLVTLAPESTFEYAAKHDRVTMQVSDCSLLPLGNPIHGKFVLETTIEQLPPEASAGLVFQYRKQPQTIGTLHPFSAIQLTRKKDGACQLVWKNYRWHFARSDSELYEEPWSTVDLSSLNGQPIALQIEFGSQHLPIVKVNDEIFGDQDWQKTKQLLRVQQITNKKLAEEYLGTIGLFASGNPTRFCQTRIKYII